MYAYFVQNLQESVQSNAYQIFNINWIVYVKK